MNKMCPFCNKKLNGGKHIYQCKNKPAVNSEDLKLKFLLFNFPIISNEQTLRHKYEIELYSLPSLRREYGIDFKSVLFLLDYYHIPKRNASESALKISNEKCKSTCLSKYGVENVSQSEQIKEKKKQTFLKHYGVDNIRKSPEFYDYIKKAIQSKYSKTLSQLLSEKSKNAWDKITDEQKNEWLKKSIHNFEQVKNTNHIKYGFDWYQQTEISRINHSKSEKLRWNSISQEEKNKIFERLHCNFDSNLERRVDNILCLLSLPFKRNCFISGKQFDFILFKQILLEVNGDYWHANPEKYNKYDMISYPNGVLIKAGDIWKKDFNKKHLAESNGYKVVSIWEKEINSITDEELKNFILKRLEMII